MKKEIEDTLDIHFFVKNIIEKWKKTYYCGWSEGKRNGKVTDVVESEFAK